MKDSKPLEKKIKHYPHEGVRKLYPRGITQDHVMLIFGSTSTSAYTNVSFLLSCSVSLTGCVISNNVHLGEKCELKDCLVGNSQSVVALGKYKGSLICQLAFFLSQYNVV